MSYDITLAVPCINQLAGQTTDGRPSESASYDCGEACCAAIVQYLTGVVFLPDEIHDIIGVLQDKPAEQAWPTTQGDLQAFLTARADCPTTLYSVSSVGQAMSVIRKYLFENQPLIVLRSFAYPGDPTGHWCVVRGAAGPDNYHTETVSIMTPWTGYYVTQSNSDFYAWMLADYPSPGLRLLIGIDRNADPYKP